MAPEESIRIRTVLHNHRRHRRSVQALLGTWSPKEDSSRSWLGVVAVVEWSVQEADLSVQRSLLLGSVLAELASWSQ